MISNFFQKLRKMSQNVSSAAVVIGALLKVKGKIGDIKAEKEIYSKKKNVTKTHFSPINFVYMTF